MPTLQELPKNLETVEADAPTTASAESSTAADAQALIDDTQTLITGEELMFAMDVPYVPVQEAPVALMQAASTGASVTPDFILNSCRETEHTRDGSVSPFGVVDPAGVLRYYLVNRDKKSELKLEDIKFTLLTAPQHGKLKTEFDSKGLLSYAYDPTPGYLGDDRATFMAEYKGKHYKIVVTIKVLEIVDESGSACPPPKLIKVNNKSVSDASPYQLNSFTITFGDLTGGAVGQTTGEGVSAAITLDATAAGHNWYIDPTPLDNTDDYLPTSNPNIWQAKAGSDAAGKMDMLSVLLHEYGHALGLDHSADSGDYMAATLLPGQRRMPSADELTLMSQLVAQLKASTALADGSTPTDPTSPTLPNPSLPLGALLIGRLALGRKPEDEGQGSQALFSANPTLQGGNLSTLQDWATQGSVAASSASVGFFNSSLAPLS